MLSAVTLGLSSLQLVLAIAVLGLSASVISESSHKTPRQLPHNPESGLWISALRYCIFLGAYGIISTAVTVSSLFVSAVLTLVPLVLNTLGTLLFLAGGITWAVNFNKLMISCGKVTNLLKEGGASDPFAMKTKNSCKQCAAAEVLLFIMFPLSACLAVCAFLQHRTLKQSARYL